MAPPRRHSHEIPPERSTSNINVGQLERIASVVSGGLLAIWGLRRFSVLRILGAATGGFLIYRGATGHDPVFEELDLDTAAPGSHAEPLTIEQSVTVARPRDEVYSFWRDFSNLPHFMHHLESVEQLREDRSLWVARVPKGVASLTWEAEITEEDEGRLLSWRSLSGADIDNAGTVRFNDLPGDRVGTEVHVTINYRPPAGDVGRAAASLLNPANQQMIKEDIRRFKNLLETGEVPTTEGQPAGRSS